jgi:3-methyladenine DNA glycosylase AlkD
LDKTANELTREVLKELASLPRLDTPSVRHVGKRYSRLLGQEPGKSVYSFALSLLETGTWRARVVAWEMLADHKDAFEFLNDREVEKMATGLNDWGSVDLFGVTVLGQAWREGLVSDRKIHSWAKSSNSWKRRLALVATVPLNSKARGGSGDARRTLEVCRILLEDRDDMVMKALSWALRELAKKEPALVEEFIELEEDRVAALVKREVRNKLVTGKKTRRHPG